jgi:hypothetical protein
MTKISYSGYRFPPEIIHQAIWLYLRFTLSFRDVEDLLAEPGIEAPSTDVVLHPLKADIPAPNTRARSLLNGGMASSLGLHPAARRLRHRRFIAPQTAGVDVERT